MARNITYESCTLVYTLLDDSVISFDDFFLLVRSLHSYLVDEFIPNKAMKNVHVKLGYQASINNARNKLGLTLQNVIGITKLSNHIKESEFSRLELLRCQFGLPSGSDEPLHQQSVPQRRNGGGRGRGAARPSVFPTRPQPYQKKVQKRVQSPTPIDESTEDAQQFPGNYEAYADAFESSENNTGN